MSPRAAWRLESLGFDPVYDYVGSKMDWIGAGLAWEGTERFHETLGGLADADVPVCGLDETVGEARARLGRHQLCVVINRARVVLGLVAADALGDDDGRPISTVMQEGPSTYRPHVIAAEMAGRLAESQRAGIPVTTLDGRLVGVVRASDIGAGDSSGPTS